MLEKRAERWYNMAVSAGIGLASDSVDISDAGANMQDRVEGALTLGVLKELSSIVFIVGSTTAKKGKNRKAALTKLLDSIDIEDRTYHTTALFASDVK
ncbi:hypothetical protein H0H92_000240, partial [Tricholoma furcatifolium]